MHFLKLKLKLKFILKMVGNDKYDVGLLSKCWGGGFGSWGAVFAPQLGDLWAQKALEMKKMGYFHFKSCIKMWCGIVFWMLDDF